MTALSEVFSLANGDPRIWVESSAAYAADFMRVTALGLQLDGEGVDVKGALVRLPKDFTGGPPVLIDVWGVRTRQPNAIREEMS